MKNRKQQSNVTETTNEQPEAMKAEKPKKQREPLDPSSLKPEAAEHLAKGSDAKAKLAVAAEALEILGLTGTAKRMWKEAERAFAAAEREARQIQKAGSKEERATKAMERKANAKAKKLGRIAKLREQLEKLMADEAAASD